MNGGIIVPEWNKRSLQPGFVWQSYFIPCIRLITEEEFRLLFNNSYTSVKDRYAVWKDEIGAYIVNRCQELGFHLVNIGTQLGDQPGDKPVEQAMWNARNAKFVAAIWAFIEGPVKEVLWCETDMPMENFWPEWVSQMNGIAEILDATKLTLIEQSTIASEDDYDL
jgi:hypothetical protein